MSRSIVPESWVAAVLERFASEEMGSVKALDCVSTWPLLLLRKDDDRPILCGRALRRNVLFDEDTTSRCVAEKAGGYDQEVVVVSFLKRCYFFSEAAAELGLRRLRRDVRYLYEVGIFDRKVDPCIKYMYERVVCGPRLMDFVQLACWAPIHPDLAHAVFEFGRWLTVTSQGDPRKAADLLVDMVLRPLHLDSEREWQAVESCKRLCGLRWRRRAVAKAAAVEYGDSGWEWEWRTTLVTYRGKTFHERPDERLVWVAVWLLRLASGDIYSGDGPMQLLAVSAKFLH